MHPFAIPEPPPQNYSFAQHIGARKELPLSCGLFVIFPCIQNVTVSAFTQLLHKVFVTLPVTENRRTAGVFFPSSARKNPQLSLIVWLASMGDQKKYPEFTKKQSGGKWTTQCSQLSGTQCRYSHLASWERDKDESNWFYHMIKGSR